MRVNQTDIAFISVSPAGAGGLLPPLRQTADNQSAPLPERGVCHVILTDPSLSLIPLSSMRLPSRPPSTILKLKILSDSLFASLTMYSHRGYSSTFCPFRNLSAFRLPPPSFPSCCSHESPRQRSVNFKVLFYLAVFSLTLYCINMRLQHEMAACMPCGPAA